MSDLWALPTEEELNSVDLAVGFAALVRGHANKRQAILKLVAVSVAILVAEDAEAAQLAAMIQRGLDMYRQRQREEGPAEVVGVAAIRPDLKGEPAVILGPGVQAKLDSDPTLKKAFAEMSEKMAAAMQGVKEGRYKSFDDAMDAIAGQRPQPLNEDDVRAIEQFEAEMLPTHKTKQ